MWQTEGGGDRPRTPAPASVMRAPLSGAWGRRSARSSLSQEIFGRSSLPTGRGRSWRSLAYRPKSRDNPGYPKPLSRTNITARATRATRAHGYGRGDAPPRALDAAAAGRGLAADTPALSLRSISRSTRSSRKLAWIPSAAQMIAPMPSTTSSAVSRTAPNGNCAREELVMEVPPGCGGRVAAAHRLGSSPIDCALRDSCIAPIGLIRRARARAAHPRTGMPPVRPHNRPRPLHTHHARRPGGGSAVIELQEGRQPPWPRPRRRRHARQLGAGRGGGALGARVERQAGEGAHRAAEEGGDLLRRGARSPPVGDQRRAHEERVTADAGERALHQPGWRDGRAWEGGRGRDGREERDGGHDRPSGSGVRVRRRGYRRHPWLSASGGVRPVSVRRGPPPVWGIARQPGPRFPHLQPGPTPHDHKDRSAIRPRDRLAPARAGSLVSPMGNIA